ncbi:MAG: hypothetical protein OXI81_01985 [Paracoccaceae bacterium]|nr:hypothetical protein [Paracoccaceae bacterium]
MSSQNGQIVGCAVFGTWHGLQACGNGVLANAHNTLGVFEFGRSLSDLFHKFDEDRLPAIFCRRAKDETRLQETELVGMIASCKDSQRRRGFLGACIAVEIDRRRPYWFGNWQSLGPQIYEDFVKVQNSFDGATERETIFSECIVPPTNEDEEYDWVLTTREETFLHRNGSWKNDEYSEIMERVQAIAFRGGTHHPTIFVFDKNIEGLQSLWSEGIDSDLELLRKAKNEFLQQRGEMAIHSGSLKGREEVVRSGQMIDRSTDMEEWVAELNDLKGRVWKLESKVNTHSLSIRPPGPAPFPALKLIVATVCVAALLAGGVVLFRYWPFGQTIP